MVVKTAIITLVSTLVIAILALSSQQSGDGSGWANGSASVTGASASYSGGGRGNWGGNTSSITGASGSYSGGGEHGDWGDDDHGDDHDDGGWDDD